MKDIFIDITKEIYDFKELGDNEFKSCKLLKRCFKRKRIPDYR